MSEPWTTKQHLWVKEQYNNGRTVTEFWEEFEPLFGVKRTKCAFYHYVKKIAIEEGRECNYHRKEWTEEEIKRLVKLHGVMKIPQIARVIGRTVGSVEGQVAKMRREGTLGRTAGSVYGQIAKMRKEGTLSRKKRVRICWLSEREQAMEREWGL